MRISDWSSDVCSSDLSFSRPFLTSRKGEDIGYVELYRAAKDSIATRYDADPHDLGMHAAIADTKLVNRGIAPLMLPRLMKDMFALEPECRRIMFDPDHRNIGARRLVEYVGCTFLGEHQMRSEEHTSELQSLMRISYAVICLKKKTNR